MTIRRTQSGGYRQRAWDALRRTHWNSLADLVAAIDCDPAAIKSYLRGLEKNGLVERRDDDGFALIRDTGPRSPSFNVQTGAFRDWNVDPAMTATKLRAAIAASGLSIKAWLVEHGFDGGGQTRLRQMMNGQRPVSPAIAAAVEAERGTIRLDSGGVA